MVASSPPPAWRVEGIQFPENCQREGCTEKPIWKLSRQERVAGGWSEWILFLCDPHKRAELGEAPPEVVAPPAPPLPAAPEAPPAGQDAPAPVAPSQETPPQGNEPPGSAANDSASSTVSVLPTSPASS